MSSTTRAAGSAGPAAVAVLVGGLVAVALGVYGRSHTPTGEAITTFGFASMIEMKVWLAALAGGLAVVQLVTALRLFGRIGRGPAAGWVGLLHRGSGAVAVIVSVPVAYHCLWSLGFGSYDARVLVHSLAGCAFYGAFVTKLLSLHSRRLPGWLLPVAGATVFTALVVVVLTSAGWYLGTVGLPTG